MSGKNTVSVKGVVRRIGVSVREGDQTSVSHILALEDTARFLTLVVDTGDSAKWRSISASLALTLPGDCVEFDGVLGANGIYHIHKFRNNSFPPGLM